ncbi:MAG: glutathione S-transferase family protein [Pseudomonadota bacterium]
MRYRLHVFPFSNYCEKTLWAFDELGVDYETQTHFAGPHARAIKKLSGQTSVPVLETGDKVITGSAAIIAHVANGLPESRFMPHEHAAEILQWQERLDEIGGTLRAALFYDLLPHPSVAITALSMGQKRPWSAYGLFFRAMIPVLLRMLRKNVPDAGQARTHCTNLLDEIADATAATGYLVGDRFSFADIAAAATFFPICMPDFAMGQPRPKTFPALADWRASWHGHRAIPYIERIYADHRMGAGDVAMRPPGPL